MSDPWREAYDAFLADKAEVSIRRGFDVEDEDIHPILKLHQRAMVRWGCAGGCRAWFASFGLGKTLIQLETLRQIRRHHGADTRCLIVAPLGVRQEFKRDARLIDLEIRFVRRSEEVGGGGIYITNYESVRDGKLDPGLFEAVSLDEAAVLRSFGGTKTFRKFMAILAGDDREAGVVREGIRYRFVATATPAPNELLELVAYAAFLGIMDIGQAKTRFFKRDSTKADKLTLLPNREHDFWMWVASWAAFVDKPSDLGYSDEGYALPPIEVHWHEVEAATGPGADEDGQMRITRSQSLGVTGAAREKRESLPTRLEKMQALMAEDPGSRFLLWHDLEIERRAIEAALGEKVAAVYGTQSDDEKEERIIAFSDGEGPQHLAAKPVQLGSGCNFQRHCHRAIFLGIGFKFKDFIQAVHRIYRFLQDRPVRVDLIYTSAERGVREILETKWQTHKEMQDQMRTIVKEHGLSEAAIRNALTRSLGVERQETAGEHHRMICNDSVLETREMEPDSISLILTSIPFSTQYEYTPAKADMGHSRDNEHFWKHMDFLVPELYRTLRPGRCAAIHVKDRIVPGGINGLGFQTVYPFSDETRVCFERHGFAFLGRRTIVTDVVRENNQTYRLGWSEQCKDGTKMGSGMPEYLMLFRKPPTDSSNGYADDPVVKAKPDVRLEDGTASTWRKRGGKIIPSTGYSRSRWQVDAHGYWRSSGDRPLLPEDLEDLPHAMLFQLFRKYTREQVYDYWRHVALGEHLEARHRLPVSFMLLQPDSWSPEVWADIMRAQTLNVRQGAKGREHHLCPMQFDIADRVITQLSMPGEIVYDPFAGLGTVPMIAVKLGRIGWGCELSPLSYLDACAYIEEAEQERAVPTLFDLIEMESEPDAASDAEAAM